MSQDETLQKLLDRRDALATKLEKLSRQRERLEKKRQETEQEAAALNMVLQSTLGIEPPAQPASPRRSASGRRARSNSLTEQVRSAIEEMSGAFEARDIAAQLQASGNEDATEQPVRKILARLAREPDEDVEVEHKGAGTVPSVYRRRAQVEEAIGGQQDDEDRPDPPSWADSRLHETEAVHAGA